MAIDWFTVVAQILNFLILVWLLKRFLYQPILDAIDAREQRIADELANADAKQQEATKERDEFAQKNATFAEQRKTLLAQATDDADKERQRLLGIARTQADALSEKRHAALEREQQTLQTELRRLACTEVFSIARKALSDLADISLEQRIAEAFVKQLQSMDEATKNSLATVLAAPFNDSNQKSNYASANEPILVRSAFDLPAEQQAAIQTALNTQFSADIPLRFETAARVVSGIELSVKGQKISWSIDEYLTALEKNSSQILLPALQSKSVPKAESTSPSQENSHAAEASKEDETPDKSETPQKAENESNTKSTAESQ
jgi:F-type H+-transporting ATPase subunit b